MQQGLTWLIALAVIALMFWAIMRENSRLKRRTSEEYERDLARTQSSLMRAGMLELDKFVGNESGKRAAVEYIKDEKGGRTRTGGKADDADRTEGISSGQEQEN